jgi:hypothetical protein
MHAGVVTTRATNRIDIEYLKYLPFTQVFSSSDRIHEKLFSSVANKGQEFIPGPALKSALREMADYYDSLSEGDKAHGSIVYADFPPVTLDNAFTQLFDRRDPNWRNGANLPEPPRDTSKDAEILAEAKARMEFLRKNAR